MNHFDFLLNSLQFMNFNLIHRFDLPSHSFFIQTLFILQLVIYILKNLFIGPNPKDNFIQAFPFEFS